MAPPSGAALNHHGINTGGDTGADSLKECGPLNGSKLEIARLSDSQSP